MGLLGIDKLYKCQRSTLYKEVKVKRKSKESRRSTGKSKKDARVVESERTMEKNCRCEVEYNCGITERIYSSARSSRGTKGV